MIQYTNVSVQGVVALGSHFATSYQELNFYEAIIFCIINFQKVKENTLTLLIILIVKSLQIELPTYIAQIYYYDPQSNRINVQSYQSATTPRRLILVFTHGFIWAPYFVDMFLL